MLNSHKLFQGGCLICLTGIFMYAVIVYLGITENYDPPTSPIITSTPVAVNAEDGTGIAEHSSSSLKPQNVPFSDASTNAPSTKSRSRPKPIWTYKCVNRECVRTLVDDVNGGDSTEAVITPFEVCWLTCGPHGALWPHLRNFTSGFGKAHTRTSTVKFLPQNVRLQIKTEWKKVKDLVRLAFDLKKRFFENYPGLKPRKQNDWFSFGSKSDDHTDTVTVQVTVVVKMDFEVFKVGSTDESYDIEIKEEGDGGKNAILHVQISGATFYGVRHGLETFSQLVALNPTDNCLEIVRNFSDSDGPAFPYRGIMIDVGRSFIPMGHIKRVIDAMSYNKLNIFHFHLTESNSFPFYSKRVPQMTEYGAFEGHIYYPGEISELVQYARIRGVKIIPELDTPSHAGHGWQFGEKYGLGKLAFHINEYDNWNKYCAVPPCGMLNPINNNTYDILEKLYADMFELFDKDLFHMGGDEANFDSLKIFPEFRDWFSQKDGLSLWKFFQVEALKRLRNQSPKVTAILWTSGLTESELKIPFLNETDYILQTWESPNITKHFLERGFRLILSFPGSLYLDYDCEMWLDGYWPQPYNYWQKFYDQTFNFKQSHKGQILGGEAPLWGEKVGPETLEVKLWPRASALAERLWSNPKSREKSVTSRLNYHVYRMQQRGIPVKQLQPESCLHFRGHCT